MKFKALVAAAAFGALAMTSGAFAQDKGTVGISMPTKSSARWIADGDNMVKVLKAKGYGTDLQYAEDDIPNQLAQIEGMISKKVKVLVIASIDGTTLTAALQKAADSGIKVIAYDRLIRNSPNVSYYATFDNFQVGVQQASTLEKALGLKDGKGPFNIELFAGSPDDNNAGFFFNGAMSVLDPYIKSGKLVVKSGQTAFDKVATLRWDGATAQARMDAILSGYYGKDKVNAVLSPYDGISMGIISSLKGVGYGTAGQPLPFVSGQDAEVPSVKSIIKGEQYSTIFKDTRELAKVTANMIDAVLQGKEPEVNDTKTYDNGKKVVPSYLLKPVPVDASNWKEILVGSGYYTEAQLK
jgi:putative multiple sugar transport system substrate-binding protein